MTFTWTQTALLDGELLYRQSEYSIDFRAASSTLLAERLGSAGSTSLSFMTLQIEVGIEHSELLYPWGLFSNTRWQPGQLTLPPFKAGRVRIILDEEKLQAGVSVSFPGSISWPIIWDEASGWICVGDADNNAIAIEYAKNAAVVLDDGQLVALWLRPKIVN